MNNRLASAVTAIALACLAAPGMAKDDIARLAACFDSAPAGDRQARLNCVNVVYDACEETKSDNQYPVGCFLAEARAWEALMNREFALTAAMAESRDNDAPPGRQGESDYLAMSQVAWRDYQMALCDYAYAKWGTGSMRQFDSAICARDMFAARTIFLWQERQPLPWPEDVGWHAR